MSRQQKVLFPKTNLDCSNNAGLLQFQNSRLPHHHYQHVQDKPPQQIFRTKRKHVLKACDRCRVKKSKCDGNQPCGRCLAYNQCCIFRDRKATQEKVYSRGFVEMLISQHAVHLQALQDLYRRCVSREGLPGSPLEDPVHGRPGTHAILDRLGLIKHAEEMTEDPQAVLADIIDYLKSLETASDGLESAESTDPSEATQSGGPSPEPSTPRELPEASEPSIADKWSGSAENYHQYQGIDNHKSAPQPHHHHQQQQHQDHRHHQQHPSLSPSMGSFTYQDHSGHSHLLEPSSIQQQRYGPVDICCQENELPSGAMWSLPYSPHHMPGFLPYGNREQLMAMEQDNYSGVSQYGHAFYSTYLQR